MGGGVGTLEWVWALCGHHIKNDWGEQWICIKFYIKLQHSSTETIWMIQKTTAMGNCWLAASLRQHTHSCITSYAEFFGKTSNTQVTQPPCSPYWSPRDFWLFPKLKSPFKRKRFQIIDEIQENMLGQLMVIGWTVWGPKVPTLKGTEGSFCYLQCLLYLLMGAILPGFRDCSLINRKNLGLSVKALEPWAIRGQNISSWKEHSSCFPYFPLLGLSGWLVRQWWVRLLRGWAT